MNKRKKPVPDSSGLSLSQDEDTQDSIQLDTQHDVYQIEIIDTNDQTEPSYHHNQSQHEYVLKHPNLPEFYVTNRHVHSNDVKFRTRETVGEESVSNTVLQNFIVKTYLLCLDDTRSDIFFSKDGKHMIIDTKVFTKNLWRHFNHCNFTSFQRQLNNYCFETVACVPGDTNELVKLSTHKFYFHENFQRDHPTLLYRIEKRVLRTPKRARSNECDTDHACVKLMHEIGKDFVLNKDCTNLFEKCTKRITEAFKKIDEMNKELDRVKAENTMFRFKINKLEKKTESK